MTRQTTRQVLALGSLAGFIVITSIYGFLVYKGIDPKPLDIVLGMWGSITSSAVTFYFTADASE